MNKSRQYLTPSDASHQSHAIEVSETLFAIGNELDTTMELSATKEYS